MKGRRPEPAEIKARKHGPEKAPGIAPIEQLRGAGETPPDWLLGLARKIWTEIVPALSRSRLMRETDRMEVAVYCQDAADFISASLQLRHEGRTYQTSSPHTEDMRRLNPLVLVADRASRRLMARASTLGLNAMSRTQLLAKYLNAGEIPPERARDSLAPPAAPHLPGMSPEGADFDDFGCLGPAGGDGGAVH